MSKDYYIAQLKVAGVSDGIIEAIKKNSEEELKQFLEQFGKKKKGPKTEIITADSAVKQIKAKNIAIGDDVSFDLKLGKGGSVSAGKVTAHVVSYKVYALVEFTHKKTGKLVRKELDLFKI